MAHLSPEELKQRLTEARVKVEVGGHYAHYKHPEESYVVQGFCIIETTDTVGVIYENPQAHIPFMRPLEDFLATVEHDGHPVPRFTKC